MSNLPEIVPVSDKHGICYIVVVTPEFPRPISLSIIEFHPDDTGAWWQVVNAMNGKVMAYGFAKGLGGCMLRAMNAGKKAARYRIKKREDSYKFLQRGNLE